MLYIVITPKRTDLRIEKGWHIGEKPPLTLNQVLEIVEIQADGNELEYIKNLFKDDFSGTYSIPVANSKRVHRWYGDIAKTIVSVL